MGAGEHIGSGGDDWHGVFLWVRWRVGGVEVGRYLNGCGDAVSCEIDVFEHHGMKFCLVELDVSEMYKYEDIPS